MSTGSAKVRSKTTLLFAVLSLFAGGLAEASIDHRLAVKALVGEAVGQQDAELEAHAFALKNRGTLRGVYGLRAPHVRREPPSSFARAGKFWKRALSGTKDPVAGRTEWRSEYDLRKMRRRGQTPRSQGLYDPIKIGDTTFFRLK